MTRNEITGERPTEYSKWHRTLPDNYPMLDIDSIEIRNNNPVAIIEIGRLNRAKFSKWQEKIVKLIANALEIPAFFVEYKIENGNGFFKIKNLFTNKIQEMDIDEYSSFIKNLETKKLERWM